MVHQDGIKLLRIGRVIELTGVSRTSIHNLRKRNQFPEPVRIGPRMVAWRSNDLQTWMTNPDCYDLI